MEALCNVSTCLLLFCLLIGPAVAAPLSISSDIKAKNNQVHQAGSSLLLSTKLQRVDAVAEHSSLSQRIMESSEWRTTHSSAHLAGYASAGYSDQEGSNPRFDQVKFAPILHYRYKNLVLLESELEIEVEGDGTTATKLEYLTLDWFINDYMALVAGKFLSPIGQFRQNLHPSWINKLPSAPPGFGHDEAAPVAEVGAQLRGGFPLGKRMRANYAVFVGNGPELEVEDGEIEAVGTEGFARDFDARKVYGFRFGLFVLPKLEVGVSAAKSRVAVASEKNRDYKVYGVDAAYRWRNLSMRAEYVNQKVGALPQSSIPASSVWKAWYAQMAYRLPKNFEAVLRYAFYNSPHRSEDQKQWAVGLNYLFASHFIGKMAYEINDGKDGSSTNDNRFMVQLTYGF